MNRPISIFTALVVAVLPACTPVASSYRGQLSQPEEARIDISTEPIASFDTKSRATLFQYLAGNFRWEVRQEHGLLFAVRREQHDGEYRTSLNGFYRDQNSDDWRQTRVLIAFEEPHGFGHDHNNITRTPPGSDDVVMIIEGPHSGAPGNSSYLIIEGDRIYLEIYDQAPEVTRQFTQKAVAEVFAELTDVLKHQDEISTTGVMPIETYYPSKPPNAPYFNVSNASQPGTYVLDAAVNPTTPGYVYVRVYNTKTGQRFSEQPLWSRHIGWSDFGQTLFSYHEFVGMSSSEDWGDEYEARFELWYQSEQGNEFKMAETTRIVNRWERIY
ncbi:MAG: hypothetical protein AAGI69_22975 [Cyanobacteria bacterium P01_H01_bin.21]